MSKRTLYLSCPHVTGNELKYVQDAIESNWVAPLGPYVNRFEDNLSARVNNLKEVSVMTSGTAAIHIALRLAGVKKDDIVLCSSLTFIGSANPILYMNATPVFIDSCEESWCICEHALEKAMEALSNQGKKPKALISVDLFGNSPNYEAIEAICRKHNIILIEDAAEALGASFKGQPLGSFGQYGIFSFNGNKIITSSGGGALLVNTEEEKKKSIHLITQARDQAAYYQHSVLGHNYRMSNISAAIGVAQLEDLDDKIEKKKKIHENYIRLFSDKPEFHILPTSNDSMSNYWLTCLSINHRTFPQIEKLILKLNSAKIEARHVWKPMHKQPLFKDCNYFSKIEGEDISLKIFESSICLPSACDITPEEQELIVSKILEI